MCWPWAFICWWCCNILTSNQDLWLVRDKMYRDPCCTEYIMFYPKVCIMQLLKVAWYRVIALFTLYFLVYDTSIMILALPCNRGFSEYTSFIDTNYFICLLTCWGFFLRWHPHCGLCPSKIDNRSLNTTSELDRYGSSHVLHTIYILYEKKV